MLEKPALQSNSQPFYSLIPDQDQGLAPPSRHEDNSAISIRFRQSPAQRVESCSLRQVIRKGRARYPGTPFEIREFARPDPGVRGQAVSTAGFFRHHLAPDRCYGKDQSRQHLLLLRFQGSDPGRSTRPRAAARVRLGKSRGQRCRQGVASAAHYPRHRSPPRSTARNQRFHLRQHPHLRSAARAPEETAAPVEAAYARYWDRLFLEARRAGEIRADIEIIPLRIFVLGALNWTIEWFRLDSKDAVLKLARRTELLIFDGIKKA